jgi:hypothetical protein
MRCIAVGVILSVAVACGCNQSSGPAGTDHGIPAQGLGTMTDSGEPSERGQSGQSGSATPDNPEGSLRSSAQSPAATGSGVGTAEATGGVAGPGTGATAPATPRR